MGVVSGWIGIPTWPDGSRRGELAKLQHCIPIPTQDHRRPDWTDRDRPPPAEQIVGQDSLIEALEVVGTAG
jgi:hypothetical protein